MTKQKNAEQKRGYHKLNIVTMGGKGGVGKTTFMSALAEWFQAKDIPVGLLDLDTEKEARAASNFFAATQRRR